MKLNNQQQTFSELVKQEICTSAELTDLEKEYLVLSILKNIGEYSLFEDIYELKTRYVFVIKMFKKVLKTGDLKSQITLLASNKKTLGDQKTNYLLQINPNDSELFRKKINFNPRKKSKYTEKDNEKMRGFLMGAFLSGGSVNNPFKGRYHLEFRISSSSYKDLLIKVLKYFELEPKTLERRNLHIVYFKKSSEVSDILKLFKAQDSMFFLEDNRIERDLVNNMQRLVNLEVYNMDKSSKASVQQALMCKVVKTSIYYERLKTREKIYCDVRIENETATMLEICNLMNKKLPDDEKITKGSLCHITKRIKEIYEKI